MKLKVPITAIVSSPRCVVEITMCGMCVQMSNRTVFIGNILSILLRQAQLHVSDIDVGHLQVVHEYLSVGCTKNVWVVFSLGGVLQVRDLFVVRDGCVVQVTIRNRAITKPRPHPAKDLYDMIHMLHNSSITYVMQ